MRKQAKPLGLAIVGAGRVGLFRGEVAARHPAVQWIGIAEKNHNRGIFVADKIGADFVTQDHRELLKRPEVTCAIIASDEHLHVDPIMAAVERGVPMLIEKPLATGLSESARVLKAITEAKLDAVVGYTQRFRRKWLGPKEKVRTGALGDVTMVTSRAFMNRLVAIDNYKRTNDPKSISPMVISVVARRTTIFRVSSSVRTHPCLAMSTPSLMHFRTFRPLMHFRTFRPKLNKL